MAPDADLLPGGGTLPSATAVQSNVRDSDFSWQLHVQTADVSVGSYGPVLMIHWESRVTEDGLLRASEQSDALIARYGDVAALVTCSSFIPMPSPNLLGLCARLIRKAVGTQLSVTVVEGGGFWSKTARLSIDSISRLASAPYPVKTASSIQGAAEMVVAALGLEHRLADELARRCNAFVASVENAA